MLAYNKESGFSYRVVDPITLDKQNINKIFYSVNTSIWSNWKTVC